MNRIKTGIKLQVIPKQSQQVQEICFANGIFWGSGKRSIRLTHKPFLSISMGITFEDTVEGFKEHHNEEISAELFIRTNGTCVEETPKQELKQNTNKEETTEKNEVESYADNLEYLSDFWNKEETMEKNEVKSYADVKEYLIAKGLYERVLEIDWGGGPYPYTFTNLFEWSETIEGMNYWDKLDDEIRVLNINSKIESLVQDYKAKQGKEFIEHLEAQPEEVVEVKPLEKPKQYLCYVQGKALTKHIHKTLEQAKQEAQRLCRKELARVSVLEVVAEYEAEVLVKEV